LYYSRLWIHSIDGGDGDKVVLFEIHGYIVLMEIKLYYLRLWIHSIAGGDGDKVVLFEIYG